MDVCVCGYAPENAFRRISNLAHSPHSVRLLYIPCLFRHSLNLRTQGAQITRYSVCVEFRVTPLLTRTPCVRLPRMSTPPEDHPPRPTTPQVSVVAEESVYPSPTAPGRSPIPQSLRSPETEDADLLMIGARRSQGQPLPPHQSVPRDPASPESEEQLFPDPGPPNDRGGSENPKPWSYGTPKQPAPTTTSTPQTAPRLERPPTPQPTPTPQEPQPRELTLVPMEPQPQRNIQMETETQRTI